MSTNSVIGKTIKTGRYIHWDGYPEYMGKQLIELIRRDGPDKVNTTIVDDFHGWSCIDSSEESDGISEDGRFVKVPGYGTAYSDDEQPDIYEAVYEEQYGYVICDDGNIEVYDGDKLLGVINANDEDAIENMCNLER